MRVTGLKILALVSLPLVAYEVAYLVVGDMWFGAATSAPRFVVGGPMAHAQASDVQGFFVALAFIGLAVCWLLVSLICAPQRRTGRPHGAAARPTGRHRVK